MSDKSENGQMPGKSPSKNRIVEFVAALALVVSIIWIIMILGDFSRYIKTNNAQVDADLVAVTSRVQGFIREIRFESYKPVLKGDTLVVLDQEEFIINVQQAEADLKIAEANLMAAREAVITSQRNEEASRAKLEGNTASLERAEKNFRRYENMFGDSAVTRNQFDQVIAQWKTDQAFLKAGEKEVLSSQSVTRQNARNVESAHANLERKLADLEAARLQLSYTVFLSPVNGIAGDRILHTGEVVHANEVLLTVVPEKRKWITANFKETQLKKMAVGQEVLITVDAIGNRVFHGKVRNLSPATGATYSMVAPDNSTGNFVKITQRVPVIIDFDENEELSELRSGMSVTVKVRK
jgi:membrane fusion protein, multidrug efflux system